MTSTQRDSGRRSSVQGLFFLLTVAWATTAGAQEPTEVPVDTAQDTAEPATEDTAEPTAEDTAEPGAGDSVQDLASDDLADAPVEPPADPIEEPKAASPTAGYHKGFFIRSSDKPYEVKIQGRVQARYTYDILDGEDNEGAFTIPRARLSLSGHAFTESLKYKFQADFGKGSVSLKDFYVNYRLISGWLELRVGQYKRPFSRQQINSSGRLELVDRAITDSFFGSGRDIGLMLHNSYEKSPTFEYAVGLFNGTGDKASFSGDVTVDLDSGEGEVTSGKFSNVPDQMDPTVVLRVGYNHGGIKGYREADLEGGPFRFSLAGGGFMNLASDDPRVVGAVDFSVKANGFSSTGAFYVSSAQSDDASGGQSLEAIGGHLQAGYVIADRFQPAVRYAVIAPQGSDNDTQEILGGLSVYFFQHGLKWQTDGGASMSEEEGGQRTDYLVRSQVQMAF